MKKYFQYIHIFLIINELDRVPAGVRLAEKVTNLHGYSNGLHILPCMELEVWQTFGGGFDLGN